MQGENKKQSPKVITGGVGEACGIRVEACRPVSGSQSVCTANREGSNGEE